mmetsp:Transcript_821/g.2406  ORF Transcript_821/g.2406 Transcript_821/m.2406 type:complete len:204 (-) Transcript_821:916-1527(-)
MVEQPNCHGYGPLLCGVRERSAAVVLEGRRHIDRRSLGSTARQGVAGLPGSPGSARRCRVAAGRTLCQRRSKCRGVECHRGGVPQSGRQLLGPSRLLVGGERLGVVLALVERPHRSIQGPHPRREQLPRLCLRPTQDPPHSWLNRFVRGQDVLHPAISHLGNLVEEDSIGPVAERADPEPAIVRVVTQKLKHLARILELAVGQ